MPIDLTPLRNSLNSLTESLDFYESRLGQGNMSVGEHSSLRAGTIKHFEITYDMAWKVLRRHLHMELRIPDIPNSPRPVFRIAAENHLVGGGGQRWQDYSSTRIQTTHMYSEEIVDSAIALIPTFLRDTADLIQRMEQGTRHD